MYSMDPDKRAKRPVVTTLTAAMQEVARWLAAQRLDEVVDADGLAWRVETPVDQVANPEDPKGVLWRLRFVPSAAVDAATLVRTGTLDAATDGRLLALLGDGVVKLRMKPTTYTAVTEEELRLLAADAVPRLKADFGARTLHEVKRALIGRHVDERGLFGAVREK